MGIGEVRRETRNLILKNFGICTISFAILLALSVITFSAFEVLNEILINEIMKFAKIFARYLIAIIYVLEVVSAIVIIGPALFFYNKMLLIKISKNEEDIIKAITESYASFGRIFLTFLNIAGRLLWYVIIVILSIYGARYLILILPNFRIIAIALGFIPYVLTGIFTILSLKYFLSLFVLIEYPEMTIKSVLNRTFSFMEGNLIAMILLIASHGIWILFMYIGLHYFNQDMIFLQAKEILTNEMICNAITFIVKNILPYGIWTIVLYNFVTSMAIFYTKVRDGHINNPFGVLYRASDAHSEISEKLRYDGKV